MAKWHPVEACGGSKAARELFDALAIDCPPEKIHPAVIKWLLGSGLVRIARMAVVGKDSRGNYVERPEYVIPYAVHEEWCTWKAEQSQHEVAG